MQQTRRRQKRFGFDGFDANHDPHGHAARDLVKLGGFEEIKDWVALDSHSQSSLLHLSKYVGARIIGSDEKTKFRLGEI